jgi:putative Mn2+ efflux pump MntP
LPGLEPDPNSTGAEEHGKMGLNVVVLQPLGALIAGILILIMPRLLNFIVALYLILIGLIGLAPHFLR